MEYLITPTEATDWQINENDLIKNLHQYWLDSEIKPITNIDDYHLIEWEINVPETGHRLDGALHRDRQGISLDGYIEDCASFAIWFRLLVPEVQKLLFYDQAFNHNIELKSHTSRAEIIEPFLALA